MVGTGYGERNAMLDFGYYNMDCLEGMKEFPDNYFDLAIVDPPFGDAGQTFKRSDKARFGGRFDKYKQVQTSTNKHTEPIRNIAWDTAPGQEYFEELFRVSRNQIIWGGNYFGLPPTRCFLIWRKTNIPEKFSMAMCEYAWTSFNDNAKVFECSSQGDKNRFHPTTKPIQLYKWLLTNYAQEGDRILDTHVGSASSLIACEELGFQYVGFEIDRDYYDKGMERINNATAQISIQQLMNDWRMP